MKESRLLLLVCGFLLSLVLPLGASLSVAAEPVSEDELLFFEEQVRPILARRCYECHSSEAESLEGELKLDGRAAMLTGGYHGPVLVPHKPEESLLIKVVEYLDPDLQMPPSEKMSDAEIEILRDWIARGAPAPEGDAATGPQTIDIAERRDAHWAWQKVQRPEIPAVANESWARDEIDRFILARLEEVGLSPADEVGKLVWLRRVTFDLTGLPPTREEIDAFVGDESAEAYQRVVDRLLASPAFGEAWGQHWLDLVRYAETKGHEGDYSLPHAWRYRDYVIRALNANVPYDDFLREHIAGDLIEQTRFHPETGSNESILGTTFWHLGEATHAPVDIRGEESDRIDNQIDVFGKAMQGMTIACARCHDHKFDAITTADFYALAGVIQSSNFQIVDVSNPKLRSELAKKIEKHNAESASAIFAEYRRQAEPHLVALAERLVAQASVEHDPLAVVAVAEKAPARKRRGKQEADKKTLASELQTARTDRLHPLHALVKELDRHQRGEPVARQASPNFTPIALFSQHPESPTPIDWLTTGVSFGDAPLPAGTLTLSPARSNPLHVIEHAAASPNPSSWKLGGVYRTKTFEVTGGSLWYAYRGKADVFLDIDSHRTVHSPLHTITEQKVDSEGKIAWFQHPVGPYIGHRVFVEFTPRDDFELYAVVIAEEQPELAPFAPIDLGEATFASTGATGLAKGIAEVFSAALAAVAEGNATPRDAALVNWLIENEAWLGLEQSDLTKMHELIATWREERLALEGQIPPPELAPVLVEGTPQDEYVHLRGSHKRLADEPTPRGYLEVLDGRIKDRQGSGRLELANQIASADNPLTARVWVNRLWSHLFGQGIVPSVDNFGALGEPPTHPELLDYLADELVACGWDTKQMIRRLVLSSTYRQASHSSHPLASEADPANILLHRVRVRRIPAESIRDSLLAISGRLDSQHFGRSVPIHITDFMRHNRSPKGSGPMDGEGRRSIYVEVRRNALSHFLTAFDRPGPSTTMGKRSQSNSAAQPLVLLNDPLVHQLCENWAQQLVQDHEQDAQALTAAYYAAFGRAPTDEESNTILPFVAERTKSSNRQKAWHDATLTLVNMKEFIFLP